MMQLTPQRVDGLLGGERPKRKARRIAREKAHQSEGDEGDQEDLGGKERIRRDIAQEAHRVRDAHVAVRSTRADLKRLDMIPAAAGREVLALDFDEGRNGFAADSRGSGSGHRAGIPGAD